MREAYYSDLTPTMSKDLNNDVSKSVDVRAVKNALLALITTRKGSRPFYPEFGCDLSSELFENMSPLTDYTIQTSITTAIKNFEPRVEKLKVNCNSLPDTNTILVSIYFSIITDPDSIEEMKLTLGE